ncbi:flagellar hook-basal body complex protein [Stenotrophomonas aracearum]|uniref:Flagellar hook protein FlgE n=1 Tax=Stenotrophomonas aracearum TaxID=3003272 RepID=A0ABY9YD31_9GAMM|nr:flagellar hook-basal body complex protein [Stenotrophomonas sp. A5588]WNH48585.1 flagellar hook-basal body complex protein [Stenotrophomonas sp. A5588]
MFQALFTSLSGLFSFSRSLNTVSNNVSNMNTPGFRGSDSFFANIEGNLGTRIVGEDLRTVAGDTRQTGNATDLAVDGDGYFVLRDAAGALHYTRAGQFRFNDDGVLVDSVNSYEVMAADTTGALASITIEGLRTVGAVPTTGVHISGNLLPSSASPTAPATPVDLNSITVYDTTGTARVLKMQFTRSATQIPGAFDVAVLDDTGASIGTGEVRFSVQGLPQAGYSTMDIVLSSAGGDQTLTFDFGTPGSFNGMTSQSGTPSGLTAKVDDGHGVLPITTMKFDEKGILQLSYSTTKKRTGGQVALALFANESALKLSGGRIVSGVDASQREIGTAGSGRYGKIAGASLEMSNIDLTREFADMIIIQRGYQASSRVMTVSNEMIEQLYNSTKGG